MFKLSILFALFLVAQITFASHDQWMDLTINNKRQEPIRVTGTLSWGKWYKNGNKHQEVSAPNFVILPGESGRVSASGRADASSGTEGKVFIKSETDNKMLVQVDFDCPWAGKNYFKAIVMQPHNTAVSHSDWSTKGPLGEMSLTVVKF